MLKKVGESDCVSINYTGFERVFVDLFKRFSKKGLPLDELNYNLLEKLVEFVKGDYKQSCLVCNEMLEMYENGEVNNIKYALKDIDCKIENIQNRIVVRNYDDEDEMINTLKFVFGILSIVFLYFIVISILSAILAIIFGFTAMRKSDKGFGKAGLIMGTISILITFLLFLFLQVLDVSLFTIPSWYR